MWKNQVQEKDWRGLINSISSGKEWLRPNEDLKTKAVNGVDINEMTSHNLALRTDHFNSVSFHFLSNV